MIQQEQNEINELLFRLLDNDISDQGLIQLKDWLDTDVQAKQYYCQFMEDYSALMLGAVMTDDESKKDFVQANILDDNFWKQMVEEEQNAPALEISMEQDAQPERIQKVERRQTARTINKNSLLIAILSAAALLFMTVMIHLAPPAPYEVATVIDFIDAKWSSSMPIEAGVRITAHSKPIRLIEGIVKLETDNHVEVLLQAPTEFKFISDSDIAIEYGKLYAWVSEQGLGFTVSTPNTKIVDLGTEFGVLCHINGDTEVFMYKGKANLFAGQKNANKTSQFLLAGSARKVHHRNSDVKEIALEERAIVRNINSKNKMIWKGQSLCLADIVGGGNGFGSGAINTGIEVSTGNVKDQLLNDETTSGLPGYIRVPDNPYVDGVFIPGISEGQTQITSDELTAVPFPPTSGFLWGYIFNGAVHQGTTTPRHDLKLNGTVLGTRDNPAITIHSNQGITFDLSTIRNGIPGLNISGFQAQLGISQTVQAELQREQDRSFDDFPEVKKVFDANGSKVEFWVFLDGRQIYHQEISSSDGAEQIEVPIRQSDQFLTIAVTESDDTHAYDWALLAHPRLILESAGR